MAGRAVNILGDDEPHNQSVNSGLRGDGNMTFFKTDESLSSPGYEEEDEDDDDEDEDDDDDDDDDEGNATWKSLACLLCGKPSEDLSDTSISEQNRDEPYLCASCGQRFELIQQANAGEPQVDLGLDEDGEDATTDVKPIVSLEEADEDLLMRGVIVKAGAEVGADAKVVAGGDGGGRRGPLECDECQVRFEDAASLERHAMTHVTRAMTHAAYLGAGAGAGAARGAARPFQCDVCARGFNRKDKLKLHLMVHSGDKPLKCDVCGKAFLRRDHLKNHAKTHTRARQSPARTKSASQPPPQQQARRERARSRGRDRREDRDDADLDADADADRDRERPFGCDVCRKAFSRKDNLAAHMRIHTGEKPFACDVCGKAFAEKCALKRHMVVHTQEKLYPCRVCGRAFARKGHLTEHAWLHDELKPFLCNVCGKAFARDRKLKSHMMTHSGERPYKCGVCDRAFARKDNLKSHMALHYGVRPNRVARSRSGDSAGGADGGAEARELDAGLDAAPGVLDTAAAAPGLAPTPGLAPAPGVDHAPDNIPGLMQTLDLHQGLHQGVLQDVHQAVHQAVHQHQQMVMTHNQHHLMNPMAMGVGQVTMGTVGVGGMAPTGMGVGGNGMGMGFGVGVGVGLNLMPCPMQVALD